YDYDQGEGFELNDSLLFLHGQWPYRSNEVFPFYASNYPPLFHVLVMPLFLIFGPTLTAGRVLSFAVTLLIAGLVGWVVYAKTRDKPIAAISGLMVLASNFIYHVGPLYRQHMTMVLFELLAVILISRYDDPKRGKWYIVLSMLALLAAGYTKQLSVATVAAVLFFLFLRAPKKAILAGVGLAIVAGGIFLLIDVATQHQWFINTITANANAYDYRQALDLYRQFFTLHFFTVALAIGFSFYQLYWDRLSIYTIWFGFALINSALAGKWGAGESYFATAVVASCILSGFAVVKLKESLAIKRPRSALLVSFAIPLLYLAQAYSMRHLPTDGPIFGPLADLVGVGRGASVYAGYPYYDSIGYTQVGHILTDQDIQDGDKIVAYLWNHSEKPILSEEAGFIHRINQLQNRQVQPVITNPTQLLNLWNNNALDPTELIASIDRQDFGLIVFRAQFYPPPVLQAIGARYAPIANMTMNGFQYRILAPRGDASGCDEAHFYGLISQMRSYLPDGKDLGIVNRDTRPDGWNGPAGVSELAYRAESNEPIYRLWIAPLSWQGQPPSNGTGAQVLGQDRCFQYFDQLTNTSENEAIRKKIIEALGLRG
ncbi:MAG TPA: glycosyltransferase family 39 protein, partial [Anaerolineae bacterium]|nr:glycosyltransferase family 39 protein [Anaerolineae bacterium]